MSFEELCQKKGGLFKKGIGCFLKDSNNESLFMDFPQEDGRLFYKATKKECENNGDEMVHFGEDFLTGIQVCRELGPSEYCKKHGHKSQKTDWTNEYNLVLAACMDKVQFPDHKIERFFENQHDSFLEVVMTHQKLPSSLINKVIRERPDLLPTLYGKENGKVNQKLDSENIDVAMETGEHLKDLYMHHILTQPQIAKAIKLQSNLEVLYVNQTLNASNIDLAIKTGTKYASLARLFASQKLTPSQIDMVIEHSYGDDLKSLYEYQSLNQAQIEKAIDSHKGHINGLCANTKIKFTAKQIDKVIKSSDSQSDLLALYGRYALTPKQIDMAITKGLAVDAVVRFNKLTDMQMTHIIRTFEGEELFHLYSKKGALKPGHIDLALATNQNYISMLYQYQKMSHDQVNKAIDIGINRESIYEYQSLKSTQVTKALEYEIKEAELKEGDNDLPKKKLFSHQKFTDNHIDYVIKETQKTKDENTLSLFMQRQKNRLTKQHMKAVVRFSKDLGQKEYPPYRTDDTLISELFENQKIDAEIIDYCIEKEAGLSAIYGSHGDKFTERNINNAIARGKNLDIVYGHIKLTGKQITDALQKEVGTGYHGLSALLKSEANTLNSKHIKYLIEQGVESDLETLFQTYRRGNSKKYLTETNINAAIERGRGLRELYNNNALYPNQIKKAIGNGKELHALYCNAANNFSKGDLNYAIINSKDLGNLFTCQKNLPEDIVDLAMKQGMNLHELYEHQKLTSSQLFKALEMKQELPQIYTYQIHNFTSAHFDVLIPAADENLLYKIYTDTSLKLSDEQREQVAKKISDELGMIIPPSSIVHTRLLPTHWREYEEKKKRSIESRIKERPLVPVLGVYPLSVTNPWQEIIDIMDKKGFNMNDDGKYVIDKEDPKKRIRTGKLLFRELKTEQHPLMKKYKALMSQKIRPFHYTTDALPKEQIENLEIVISDEPNDIAAKGTGHQNINEGCETVQSGTYGWKEWTQEELEGKKPAPHHGCGWCDDIKNNNAIAFIRNKKEKDPRKKWLDRAIIRWCIREDDKKPDAIIETIYGMDKYKPMLRQILTDILNKHGLTGARDGHVCTTPYKYTGYADSAMSRFPHENDKPQVFKTYKLGPRPHKT